LASARAPQVERSRLVLLFVSNGYFESANVQRELCAALDAKKPIAVVYETSALHGGGVQLDEMRRQCEAIANPKLLMLAPRLFGSTRAAEQHGGAQKVSAPSSAAPVMSSSRATAAWYRKPIAWYRERVFLDQTLLALAERLRETGALFAAHEVGPNTHARRVSDPHATPLSHYRPSSGKRTLWIGLPPNASSFEENAIAQLWQLCYGPFAPLAEVALLHLVGARGRATWASTAFETASRRLSTLRASTSSVGSSVSSASSLGEHTGGEHTSRGGRGGGGHGGGAAQAARATIESVVSDSKALLAELRRARDSRIFAASTAAADEMMGVAGLPSGDADGSLRASLRASMEADALAGRSAHVSSDTATAPTARAATDVEAEDEQHADPASVRVMLRHAPPGPAQRRGLRGGIRAHGGGGDGALVGDELVVGHVQLAAQQSIAISYQPDHEAAARMPALLLLRADTWGYGMVLREAREIANLVDALGKGRGAVASALAKALPWRTAAAGGRSGEEPEQAQRRADEEGLQRLPFDMALLRLYALPATATPSPSNGSAWSKQAATDDHRPRVLPLAKLAALLGVPIASLEPIPIGVKALGQLGGRGGTGPAASAIDASPTRAWFRSSSSSSSSPPSSSASPWPILVTWPRDPWLVPTLECAAALGAPTESGYGGSPPLVTAFIDDPSHPLSATFRDVYHAAPPELASGRTAEHVFGPLAVPLRPGLHEEVSLRELLRALGAALAADTRRSHSSIEHRMREIGDLTRSAANLTSRNLTSSLLRPFAVAATSTREIDILGAAGGGELRQRHSGAGVTRSTTPGGAHDAKVDPPTRRDRLVSLSSG
jgi:hypothetical protein